MAPRTLASTWKSLERLAKACEAGDPEGKAEDALTNLIERVNKSNIGPALATLFVNGFAGLESSRVCFVAPKNCVETPSRASAFDREADAFVLSPVGVIRFVNECAGAAEEAREASSRGNYETYRLLSYLSEIAKLPSQLLLLLQLLREVADVLEVAQVERRGVDRLGVEDQRYMTLLWAFKELERLYRELKGINLRSEYKVQWYDADWVLGK